MEKKKLINTLIRITGFLVIFVLLSYQLTLVFLPKQDQFKSAFSRNYAFYQMPKNTVDVLYLGASSFIRGINPLIIWNEYGFTGFNRSGSGQLPITIYYQMIESIEYQTPRVVVLDTVSMLSYYDLDVLEGKLRPKIDGMKMSPLKIDFIREVIAKSEKQTMFSYLYPLLRYHDRWDEITATDFKINLRKLHNDYAGYYGVFPDMKEIAIPEDFMIPQANVAELDPDSMVYFERIIRFCQEMGIDVILVTMPRDEWSYANHNAIQKFAERYNLPYLDYCLPENFVRLGIDPKVDFRDGNHLSMIGAEKVTLDLGNYLLENYHLADKRSMPEYDQWHIDYRNFMEKYANGDYSDGYE